MENPALTAEDAIEAAYELLSHWMASVKRYDGPKYARSLRRYEIESVARLRDLYDPAMRDGFAKLVEEARNGSADADAELCEWGALAISCAPSLPIPLTKYIASKLFEHTDKRARGRHPQANLPRNFVILYAVARLIERGFHPTRNREQDTQESACSIVNEALKRVGVHMEESNVDKIWGDRAQLPEALREFIDGKSRIPAGFVLA